MFSAARRSRRGGSLVRERKAAISPEAHVKHTVCGRTAPPADLLESCHLLAKRSSRGDAANGTSLITGARKKEKAEAKSGAKNVDFEPKKQIIKKKIIITTNTLLHYTYRHDFPSLPLVTHT